MSKAVTINGITVHIDNPDEMYAGWQTVEKMASKICWEHISKYGKKSDCEFDDLMQTAYLAYDRVIKLYDPAISKDIVKYLYCCIRDDLKMLYDPAHRSRILDECDSLNQKCDDGEGNTQELYNYIEMGNSRDEAEENLEKDELKQAFRIVYEKISVDDAIVLRKLLNGDEIDIKSKKKALKAARMAILSLDDEQKEIFRNFASYL